MSGESWGRSITPNEPEWVGEVIDSEIDRRDKEIERLRDHNKRLADALSATERVMHPAYGPCDGFGTGGMCSECERVVKEAEALLREARDDIEDWAGYASEYFQDKHDLKGTLAKYDAWLARREEK